MHCSIIHLHIENVLMGLNDYFSVGDPTPSPQKLKGFFLVKGRVPNEHGVEIEEGNEDDLLVIKLKN